MAATPLSFSLSPRRKWRSASISTLPISFSLYLSLLPAATPLSPGRNVVLPGATSLSRRKWSSTGINPSLFLFVSISLLPAATLLSLSLAGEMELCRRDRDLDSEFRKRQHLSLSLNLIDRCIDSTSIDVDR